MKSERVIVLVLMIFLAKNIHICGFNAFNGCSKYKIMDNKELNCNIKNEIVKIHNKFRQKVATGQINKQPPASNMQEMYWDEELAKGAQEWANQCTFAHNSNKDRGVERFPVGQNLGVTMIIGGDNNKIEFPKQIKSWFDECQLYTFGPVSIMNPQLQTGHYTQVIWANTYLVGCGFIRYKISTIIVKKLYVCNYGPAGNRVNNMPYIIGNINCDDSLTESITYPGLCSLKNPPTDKCSSNDTDVQNAAATRSFTSFVEETKNKTDRCVGKNCIPLLKPNNMSIIKKKEDKKLSSSDMKKFYCLLLINIFN